jgi:predicted Zn-dependent protease
MREGQRRVTAHASGVLRNRPARGLAALLAAAIATSGGVAPSRAQPSGGGLPIIRDAEIEEVLRDYTAPILKVAGLASQNVNIVIVNQRTFNAFVMDGRRIFVNVGAILDAKTPNEIIGVLAHEAGHIAGGHLARLRQELANAQTSAILAILLSAGAVAAGATMGGSGARDLGQLGMAGMSAGPEMIKRSLLSYQRSQEESADRAAVRFLEQTGQSAKGMSETFRRLADQTMFLAHGADPYLQSHPMPRERVEALSELARTSPHWSAKDSAALQLRHDMMRAKLIGFLERGDGISRRFNMNDDSLPARYARAISAYRFGDLRNAISQIDALIQAQPNNPYFHELKGQALLENGRPKEAIGPLRRAVALAPGANLIRVMLGQALVASNDPQATEEAITLLRNALARDKDLPQGYQQLAIAFGRKGQFADADLASAQAAFAAGEIKTARELAGRARTRFPTGSPGWVRADDIYSYKPPSPSVIRRN